MQTNLPVSQLDNSKSVKQFFDNYFINEVTFPAGEIDATVGFFTKRDFDRTSSNSIAIVLLNQARQEGISVFKLLDTMKSLTDVQLSQIVAQVLNGYRERTSLLGYRIAPTYNSYETRNVLV